eukprot:TRINITY_DN3173_c0_g1_i1.p1 TRINITY_DN3173_c0_g1~~TRINITY_DN3173_c0_g1_i1.p1  ORF type:complete len:462 (-),score=84.71 TRINITY_DN3173_c0_g1_i1:34-1419(-)
MMTWRGSIILTILALAVSLVSASGRTPEEWKDRIIYQVLTDRFSKTPGEDMSKICKGQGYCGGTFMGLVSKLDYIEALGANAIWISPVFDNFEEGFHGYWPRDFFAVNAHFGTEDELRTLVKECHKRDIWVMIDTVANHAGRDEIDSIKPFNNPAHYHSYCLIKDWSNQWEVENCRLAGLPDLKQEVDWVRDKLIESGQWLFDFGIDGLRVDTVPEVPSWFWDRWSQAMNNTYMIGEVYNGDPSYVASYQGPLTSVLSYPAFFKERNAFINGASMKELQESASDILAHFKDPYLIGSFADNHDQTMFLNLQPDYTLYKNQLMTTLTFIGVPIIYQGTEQGYNGPNDPWNRDSIWPNYNTEHEIFQFLSNTISVLKETGLLREEFKEVWADNDCYVYLRGGVAVVGVSNRSKGFNDKRTVLAKAPNGTQYCERISHGKTTTVKNGYMNVSFADGMPILYTLC